MTNQELAAFVKKNPIMVACGLISVGLLVSLYFRGDLRGEAEEQLAAKSALGERYAANIKHAAHLEEQLNELVAANQEIEARAIRIKQLGTNSQFFYKLETETGVKLIDFRQNTQSAAAGKGVYTPVTFATSAQGSLPQLLHFLRLLESGAHYCRINTASITANTGQRGAPLVLSLNLDLLGLP